jgi:hypothetical protein
MMERTKKVTYKIMSAIKNKDTNPVRLPASTKDVAINEN